MIYIYGESVRLNGRELSPNEYSIDPITGVITLISSIGKAVFEYTAMRKNGGKPRRKAQWKREQRDWGK